MKTNRLSGIFGFLTIFFFISSVIIGGLLNHDFDHYTRIISDVYSPDSTYGNYIAWFGFIPTGISVILFAYFTRLQTENLWFRTGMVLFGYAYGLGTIITALFPCTEGCVLMLLEPTPSQIIHQISRFLMYTLTSCAMLFFAVGCYEYEERFLQQKSIVLGVLTAIFSAYFLFKEELNWIGLFQRIIEILIMLWVAFISIHYYKISKQENITLPKN
jgi:hypothetical protein